MSLRITGRIIPTGIIAAPDIPDVVVPTDPDFANVTLLMHFEENTADVKGHVLTPTNVTFSTIEKQAGIASGVFNGVSSTIVGTSPDFAMGTGDFTFETFVKRNTLGTYQGIVRIGDYPLAGSWALRFTDTNTLNFYITDGSLAASTTTTVGNTAWTHIAVTRASNVVRIFINGVVSANVTATTNLSAQNILLGSEQTLRLDGWLDECRITKGIARYTANFTVPETPFPDS